MNVVLFGATGMIGRGVLLECLEDPTVTKVVAVVRRPTGETHAKLEEVVHADFANYDAIESKLANLDACFFCLGVSSAGMSEADYTRVTYDYAIAAATTLKKVSPNLTFCFVSGASTDSSEKGSSMWARVKGKTENAILAMFPGRAFCFRPGYIHPMKGVVSGTKLYRVFYVVFVPLYPVLRTLFPKLVTTTVAIGRAMIHAVRTPPPVKVLEVLEVPDINALAATR
jgi:uncharacterized protein YbjT (DUF2867 family)